MTAGVAPSAVELKVYTGTLADGSVAATNCGDFQSTNGFGVYGLASGGPVTWTVRHTSQCSTPHRLYCFQIDHPSNLVPSPTSGNIAFVSTQQFAPGPDVGIAGADARCANNAANASLPGAYKALLATTTASAVSRITLALVYVRPDGILIATGAAIASRAALDSGIWQRADGTYVPAINQLTYTGASTPSAFGTQTSTCNDWTSTAFGATVGRGTLADPSWWDLATDAGCSQALTVYCLQQ